MFWETVKNLSLHKLTLNITGHLKNRPALFAMYKILILAKNIKRVLPREGLNYDGLASNKTELLL